MLITIIAWFYISFLCLNVGYAFTNFLNNIFSKKKLLQPLHFSIYCLIGLFVLTTTTSIISLFSFINTPVIHFIFLCFAIFFFIKNKKLLYSIIRGAFNLSVINSLLLAICLLMILVMSIWKISHPDTLIYHQAIIKSIEDFGLRPHFANLSLKYGFQSNWFISCALFSFNFLHLHAVTFINSTTISWLVIFILVKMNRYYENTLNNDKNSVYFLFWSALLVFIFWDHTQARLTITSASPDFVVSIYLWLIFYLYNANKSNEVLAALLLLLSLFVVTLKPSVFVISFLAIVFLHKILKPDFTYLSAIVISGVMIVLPFLYRNIITSGYLFYPLTFPDINFGQWKADKIVLYDFRNYIKSYARTHSSDAPTDINTVVNMKINEWVPIWWRLKSGAEKTILFFLSLSLINLVFLSFKQPNYFKKRINVSLAVLSIAIVTWFYLAPDLRFAMGFIIPFIAISTHALVENKTYYYPAKISTFILVILIITFGAYTLYRFLHFFNSINLLFPSHT